MQLHIIRGWCRVLALLCAHLLLEIEHLQVPLAGNLVDTDKAGLLDKREQTFHVGVSNGIQFQGIECCSKQRWVRTEAPEIIDHRHQPTIEDLRFPVKRVDALTSQDAFAEDSIWHDYAAASNVSNSPGMLISFSAALR